METQIPNRLSTLGHPQRLSLFRLLMRRYPDRVPATELAQALGLKPSTLSTYVNALMHAGLIRQERVGTSLRYAIHIEAARETIDYLILDCCRGRPDICSPELYPTPVGETATSDSKFNVLFVCTGNSARSIFAEAILRDLAGDRFAAYSAGTKPGSKLNPLAVEVLEQKAHDVSALRSKNISQFQGADAPTFDFVFTVCNRAANEECASWQGQPVTAHWGLPDPVKVEGSDAEKSLAFHQTYGALRTRMTGFIHLPIASLNRISLQKAVDDLGQSKEEGTAL
jgi:arsenate reductase